MQQGEYEALVRSREARFTPEISNIDDNMAQLMKNAGYSSISVPPGITVDSTRDYSGNPIYQQPNGQFMNQQPNGHISPIGESQEMIEYNQRVNLNQFNTPNQQQQNFMQQAAPQQPAAGRGSPYAIVNQDPNARQFINQSGLYQQTPVEKPVQQEFVVQNGQLVPYSRPNEDSNVHPQLREMYRMQQQSQQQQVDPNDPIAVLQQLQGQQPVPAPPVNSAQYAQQQYQQPQQPPEVVALQQEVNLLKSMVLSQQRNTAGVSAPVQSSPKIDSSEGPQLKDYTQQLGDDWDNKEATQPDTKSGRAYIKWLTEREDWLLKKNAEQILSGIQKAETDKQLEQKANKFAAAYPQFRSFDGRPDFEKVKVFFDDIMGMDWGELKQAVDNYRSGVQATAMQPMNRQNLAYSQNNMNYAPQGYVTGQAQQQMLQPNPIQPQPYGYPNIPFQVGQQANHNSRTVPISNGGGPNFQTQPVKVPDSIQNLVNMYGNNLELPPNAIIR